MKLRIQNIAKIKHAELQLEGITVIAGNNNSGKSTVGKTVFSLYNSLFDVEKKIILQKEKLIYQMLRRMEEDLDVQDDMVYLMTKISSARLIRYARRLASEIEEELSEIIEEFCQKIKAYSKENVDKIKEEVYRLKNLTEDRLIKSAVSTYFNNIFNSEINNVYHMDEDAVIAAEIKGREISMVFRENVCVTLEKQRDILNQAIYLDNPFVLDYLNKSSAGIDEMERAAINKLRKNADALEHVVQINLIEARIQEVLDKINEVSAGSMQLDEAHSYYYKEKIHQRK